MKMNFAGGGSGGVLPGNIPLGLTKHAQNRSVKIGKDGYQSYPNFLYVKEAINANIPLIVSLDYYPTSSSAGHAVACFGYNETSDNQQLIFCNGWTRDWQFQWMGSLSVNVIIYQSYSK